MGPWPPRLLCTSFSSIPQTSTALPYGNFYRQDMTSTFILPTHHRPARKPAKALPQYTSAQSPFFLPLSHCFLQADMAAPWLRSPARMMYVRTAASSYAAHMLFGLASSWLLPKVWDNGNEGSDLQHMLPLVGVYDTVLQTDEFSVLALPWRPPSCNNSLWGYCISHRNGESREQKQMQYKPRLDHQSSASQAELVCVVFMWYPCCAYIHLGTDIQKIM